MGHWWDLVPGLALLLEVPGFCASPDSLWVSVSQLLQRREMWEERWGAGSILGNPLLR